MALCTVFITGGRTLWPAEGHVAHNTPCTARSFVDKIHAQCYIGHDITPLELSNRPRGRGQLALKKAIASGPK